MQGGNVFSSGCVCTSTKTQQILSGSSWWVKLFYRFWYFFEHQNAHVRYVLHKAPDMAVLVTCGPPVETFIRTSGYMSVLKSTSLTPAAGRWRPPVGGREFVTQLFSHKTVRVWGRVGICTEWCCFFYSLAVTNEDILQSVFWLRSANNSALKRNKGEMLCAQHSPADQFARPNTSVIAHQVSI